MVVHAGDDRGEVSAVQSLVRHWRRLLQTEPVLNCLEPHTLSPRIRSHTRLSYTRCARAHTHAPLARIALEGLVDAVGRGQAQIR